MGSTEKEEEEEKEDMSSFWAFTLAAVAVVVMIDSSSKTTNDMKTRGLVRVDVCRREEEEEDLFCRGDTILSLVYTCVPVCLFVRTRVGRWGDVSAKSVQETNTA